MKRETWAMVLYCGWALMVPHSQSQSKQPATTWGHYGSHDTAKHCEDSAARIWESLPSSDPNKKNWESSKCLPMDVIYTHAKETKP